MRAHRRSRSAVALGIAALVWLLGCAEAEPPAAAEPNIVLIVGDDHGWSDYGFMGDPIVQTPHLDALAAEGVVFPYGFNTASTCRPSLRSLLTGLHPEQWDVRRRALRYRGEAAPAFDPIRDFETLPGLLRERGYVSFQSGKYWEGSFESGGFTHGMKRLERPPRPGEPGWIEARAGGDGLAIGRETLQPLWDFLDEAGERRFFVWLAPSLPHMPHDPPQEFLDRYRDERLSNAARLYYANITRFDAMVGEVVARLTEMGLREDTLLVYLSDNGWDQQPGAPNPRLELGGVRGKSSMYELGFRTPVVFHWPGRIEGGRRQDDLVSSVDLFPTLLALAGAQAPPDRLGVDLRPALEGDAPTGRAAVFGGMDSLRPPAASRTSPRSGPPVRTERAYYVRDARWRYVWYADADRFGDRPPEQLYRIDEDPREEHDLAGEHPERTVAYRAAIERWLEEVRARTRAAL